MTSSKDLKMVAENCKYFNSVSNAVPFEFASMSNSSSISQSCASCSQWSDEKCSIGVYDSIKNSIENKKLY